MLDTLDFEALLGLGLSAMQRQHLLPLLADFADLADLNDPAGEDAGLETRLLRVTEVHRDMLAVHDGRNEYPARPATALARTLAAQDDALAVGDWVLARRTPGGGPLAVLRQLPPLSQLTRRISDDHGRLRRQVLVSNVDTALLVMGLDHDFNQRRLERYHALAHLAGVAVVLVLTKADTVDAAQRERRVAQARAGLPDQLPVLALDGRTPAAAAALAPWAQAGQTLVLLGSSGAGKSTLTNTLVAATGQPVAQVQSTGAARADDGRGRHTTTARSLHRGAGGACIIDTPGLRALRLDVGDEGGLAAAFDDVARWSTQCRFRDCRHQAEPGCAVRAAVPAERLDNYQKLLREARRDTLTILERREMQAQWKARGREAKIRMRAKRPE